jgi:hypothetical protein
MAISFGEFYDQIDTSRDTWACLGCISGQPAKFAALREKESANLLIYI